MKQFEFIGDNYVGHWDKERYACRAVICDGDKILMTYMRKYDLYMTPGGGVEEGESYEACCKRELMEETGYITDVDRCALECTEYYGNFRWINRYYICSITGESSRKLSKEEKMAETEVVWVEKKSLMEILSKFNDYKYTDEEKCGIYEREYRALKELINI